MNDNIIKPDTGWTNVLPDGYERMYTKFFVVRLLPYPTDDVIQSRGGDERVEPGNKLGAFGPNGSHGTRKDGTIRDYQWRPMEMHMQMYLDVGKVPQATDKELERQFVEMRSKFQISEAKLAIKNKLISSIKNLLSDDKSEI